MLEPHPSVPLHLSMNLAGLSPTPNTHFADHSMATRTCKVVMVGNVGVGKTTIFCYLKKNSVVPQQDAGAGEDRNYRDSCTKTFDISAKESIKV